MSLLEVRGLNVEIGDAHILRGVSFSVDAGETLGIVGESGCGKSMTGLALMGMLPVGGAVSSGSIEFDGRDLTKIRPREWLDVRGQDISMVMQDPFTSLNPMMRVGEQIAEVYRLHQGLGRKEASALAVQMLDKVGVPAPADSARKFPHQMSGGQRQRVVIAIAFASKPRLLIADEPTTALDVTLQAQILHLIRDLQTEVGTAVIVISHDIGVIGAISGRIAVYYAGRVVEIGPSATVLQSPSHPYTKALLAAVPTVGAERLAAIGGQPPSLTSLPQGCSFAPRCSSKFERCSREPDLIPIDATHSSACWLVDSRVETK
ncbi:MAG TPA: ABC transporter ATP-binding protein [Fimbriimonadaceae bacterium]|nr:ABC transporter ATP-binding protein [Fimbriimonadaceae bacterium]